jgi:hypothetical protein
MELVQGVEQRTTCLQPHRDVVYFLSARRKNNQTYIHNITKVYDFLFYVAPLNMVLLELLGMWLVVMRTGPFDPKLTVS